MDYEFNLIQVNRGIVHSPLESENQDFMGGIAVDRNPKKPEPSQKLMMPHFHQPPVMKL